MQIQFEDVASDNPRARLAGTNAFQILPNDAKCLAKAMELNVSSFLQA